MKMNKRNTFIISILSFLALTFASANLNRTLSKANAEGETTSAYCFATTDFSMNSVLAENYPGAWVQVDNVVTPLSEYSSNLTWTITSGRYNAGGNYLELTTGIASAESAYAHSIAGAADENSDEYKIASAIGILNNTNAYGVAMYTNEYTNISDFQFSLSNSEAGYFSVLYQNEGSTDWTYMYTKSESKSVSTATVKTYTSGSDYINWPLAKNKVRLAFVYRQFNHESCYLKVDNIVINRTKSIASYMDVLSNTSEICSGVNTSGTKINKYFSMLTYTLNGVDTSLLLSTTLTGSFTSETNALGLLNYLINLTGGKPLLSNNFSFVISNNLMVYFIIAVALAVSISSFVIILKRKNR